ncbi:MAG: cupredoxin domain-containing protein, partial [Candidatus Limnocylindrales bacterium]
IQFAIMGFHTATLLPAGMTAAQDMKANGIAKADTDDTTRNPGGQTHTMLNILGALPIPMGCGFAPAGPCTFDGTSVVSDSPLGPPAPFAVTITAAPGVYTFHCRIHPGMTGALTVVPASWSSTSQEDLTERVQAQIKADVRGGFAAEEANEHATVTRNEDGTRTWWLQAGVSGADGHTAVLEFLPRAIKIHKGDQVAWKSLMPNEPHTVTFPTDLFTDQVPMCETGSGDALATPNHQPPQGPTDFSCTGPVRPADEIEFAPGNGVHNVTSPATISDSGLLASDREETAFGLPHTAARWWWSVSFGAATKGTYTYVCQIHGAAMSGAITVN